MAEFFPLKGRHGKGGCRKLMDEDVRTIRRLAAGENMTARQIQANYPGVALETVRKAIRRDTFKDVADTPQELSELPEDHIAAQIRMIREAEEKRRLSAKSLLEEIGKDQPAA